MTALAPPPVILMEETFAPSAPLSPKVKALRDRLANQICEKDDINVKEKVNQRMAKSAALMQKVRAPSDGADPTTLYLTLMAPAEYRPQVSVATEGGEPPPQFHGPPDGGEHPYPRDCSEGHREDAEV